MSVECGGTIATPVTDPTDQSLLRRFQAGDQQAATKLYRRYEQRLHALVKAQCSPQLAQALEPDDVVQSVFGTFFQKASEGYYQVPAGEDLWRLLLVITLNKIRKKGTYYATAKRQGALAFGTQDFERYLDSKEAGESAFQFLQLVVREAMESLPPLHLAIMELRLQGYEVAEIAAKTERSKRTVERVLQEFRKKLDGILRQDS